MIALMPPQELEAERQFVGRALLEPSTFGDLEIEVDPVWFMDPWLSLCWRVMRDLNQSNLPINVLSVNRGLEVWGKRENEESLIDAELSVADLYNVAPSAANVNYYARLIRGAWIARALAVVGRQITNLAFATGRSLDDRMEDAERLLHSISEKTVADVNPAKPSELVELVATRLERMASGERIGVQSGIGSLDDIVRGFQPGELSIAAGRPSMGKTAIVSDVFRRMARSGKRVAFYSLETPNEQLGINWVASRARVDSRSLRDGFVPRSQLAPGGLVYESMREIAELDGFHWTIDRGIRTIFDLRRSARILVARHGVEILAVDYLQLLSGSKEARRRGRQEEVAEISREAKALSRDLGIHVVAICQLNRKSEGRPGKEPVMSDLKESGQLEQDADLIMLLHRPGYYDRDEDPEKTFVNVAKNRNGRTGRVELRFVRENNRFEEPPDREAPRPFNPTA